MSNSKHGKVYGRCVAGMEDVWIARMDATLRPTAQQDGELHIGE